MICEDEDEDVSAEHQRVASGAASSDLLQVIQLTKVYQHLKRKVHAVKKLSVGIPAGEVSFTDYGTVNQSIQRSINQSVNQSINQSICHSTAINKGMNKVHITFLYSSVTW